MKNRQRLVAAILLVMRVSFIQIAFSTLFLSSLYANEGNGQSILDKSFSISVENVQLKKVISSIQKQTKVKFTFSTNAINAQRTISYSVQDKKISDFLTEVLKPYSIGYQVVDNQIILLPITRSNMEISIQFNPENQKPVMTIKGTITDEKKEPLAGVTVSEKGTTNAVVTNEWGAYTINVENEKATLIFTSVGYEDTEITVLGNSVINLQLKMSNKALDEVIVVGYGTQKRSDVTGAVVSVPKQRLTQLPVTNILHAIEGSVPGVNITQTSSVPGSTATVLIRGQNSLTARTGPYIIVDGIPFSSTGGLTNDINPNDIASIEILKDASATAIYGVNGANGVILITTKRGNSGKPSIRYNGYAGFDNVIHRLEPLSPSEYVEKYAIAMAQRGLPQPNVLENAYEIANYNAGITTDWLDEVEQQGIIQDHNVSIGGGSKEVKYFLSGDFLKQKGAVRGYQYQRASFRANVDVTVTDYLTAGTSIFYTNNNYDGGRANFYLAAAMSPYGTVRNGAGGFELYPMYPELLYTNPLLGLNTDRTDRSANLTGNVYAEAKLNFLPGLKYRINAAKTYINTRFGSYTGRDAANTQNGSAVANSTETNSWVIENILSYTKDWGVHHIDFTGLYSAQERNFYGEAINGTGYINDELSFNNIGAGSNISAGTVPGSPNNAYTGSYKDRYGLVSQMGRINYTYDSRYLLTLTARRDGSSVMGSSTSKYGTFPSVAVGWNISNEEFMSSNSLFDNLKLRASYGKTGNEAIPPYGTITTTGTIRFPFSGSSTIGVLANNLGNANLHWETSKVLNFGLDFSIIKNRINGTIDFYSTKTDDLILRRNIPIATGYANVLDNLGKTKNTGIEIMLNTENIVTKDFRWQSVINFSSNKNRIVGIYGDGKDDVGNRWFIGQPINVIYDYEMIGVWQVGEDPSQHDPGARPGDLKFADINGSKTITPDDRKILGTTSPKWIGGIINTFHYKDFHLSVFVQTFQGAIKNNVTLTYADEGWRMNLFKETGYWTEQNMSNSRPSFRYTNTRGYNYPSDNSYTRIKDLTLSYTAPQRVLNKLKLGSLTVYASGRNLYTFTNWIGWDPEHNYNFRGSGDWTNNYPITRAVVFGVNLSPR